MGLRIDLFGGDVIRRALDAFLDGANSTRLPEVDHPHHSAVAAQDVVGLNVAMGIPQRVHGSQPLGGLEERIDDLVDGAGAADFQRLAFDQFHQQKRFGDLYQQALVDLQFKRFAKIGVRELAADLELGLHLLDETQVFGLRRTTCLSA